MSVSLHSKPLWVAIACETLASPLPRLLERQRAEEPETPIRLVQVMPEELAEAMKAGRFDAALTLSPPRENIFRSEPLWQDELAVALPLRSPLLAYASIPPEELVEYPVVMWCPAACEPINRQVHELLDGLRSMPFEIVQHVCSFGLMAALVAAGYGVGFSGRSRIASSRAMNIVMRPLVGLPRPLTTYIVCLDGPRSRRLDRFSGRAAAIW